MTRPDLKVEVRDHIAILTLARPPQNFFDAGLISDIADALEAVDRDGSVRVSILTTELKNFCAGADFGDGEKVDPRPIYFGAIRVAVRRKPMIAAVSGAAIGGGLGLALVAEMRVGDASTRMQANFVKIGISPGFGLTHTLPRLVGAQKARDLFMTGRRVQAHEALSIGLLDRLSGEGAMAGAMSLAQEIALNAPIAVDATLRLIGGDERTHFAEAVERELAVQLPLFDTVDFIEGVRAAREKRNSTFQGLRISTNEV